MDDNFDRRMKAQDAMEGMKPGTPSLCELARTATELIQLIVDAEIGIKQMQEQRDEARKKLVGIRINMDETLSDFAPFEKDNGLANQLNRVAYGTDASGGVQGIR